MNAQVTIQDIRHRLAERIAQQNHADAEQACRADGLLLDSERPSRADLPPWSLDGAQPMTWDARTGWWRV